MNAQSLTTNATGKPSVLISLDLTFVVVIEGIMAAVSFVRVSNYPSQRQHQSLIMIIMIIIIIIIMIIIMHFI